MVREIKQTDSIIETITGEKSNLFRPPYGVTNPFLSKALKRTGHKVIGWSLRSFDTSKSKRKVLKRIENRLKNGNIILLHDANPQTPEILEKIIMIIKDKGMEIVGLNELLPLKQQG
ncbi:MAG: polysaccharide deacetylase family protein [Bacteroidales bacterium]